MVKCLGCPKGTGVEREEKGKEMVSKGVGSEEEGRGGEGKERGKGRRQVVDNPRFLPGLMSMWSTFSVLRITCSICIPLSFVLLRHLSRIF